MNILLIDIIMEILLRLPVLSLIRFKCVCKTWYALIESSRFIDMQLKNGDEHIQTLGCIFSNHLILTRFDDLESLGCLTSPYVVDELPTYQHCIDIPTDVGFRFSTHSNGIICIYNTYRSKIILWNPALREFRILPTRPFKCPFGHEGGFVSAIGFGFDDTTNDYKVVCVEQFFKIVNPFNDDDPPLPAIELVQVYNLRSNGWRRLETTVTRDLVPDDAHHCGCPIFFKGSVHWLVWEMRQMPFILTFNITTELFDVIQFPNSCQDYPPWSGLSCLFISDKSTLSMVLDYSDRCPNQQLDVWVMNDYDSWTKQYSLEHPTNISRLLSFWKNDKLIYLTSDGVLFCCGLETGERHRIRSYGSGEYNTLNVVVCVETLVSVRLENSYDLDVKKRWK